ncbi:MAG: type II toxin-antitoxin system VapC family toxin [Candidatus Hydrogenedentes bacterium]|nr:type II toxin-antitoxin system VapC family toxin [Candidatus Hydrogenedentota bacterium]
MARRVETYVDTSALIAFVDRSDSFHQLFRRLFSEAPELVTTTLVVAEGHGWFLKRYDRTRALQFVSLIEDLKPLRLVAVGTDEFAGGVRMLRKFSDQNLTLTDAVGLHVMKTHGVRKCWSTDFHLGLTGVSLVIDEY